MLTVLYLLEAVNQQEQLQLCNNAQRNRLDNVQAQLASTRADMLANQFPTLIRYQSLNCSHVQAMLSREQRVKLKQLLSIFPVRISALRQVDGMPVQLTIANLRFPETMSAHVTALQQQPPQVRYLTCVSQGTSGIVLKDSIL
jgi:hypothetical protein